MKSDSKTLTWSAIVLILATGLIHFLNARDSFGEAQYKGLLFVANGVGSLVAAVGIYRGARIWGWLLGFVIAGGAIIGYVLSRTVGLPGIPAEPGAWLEPYGVASLIVEGLFVILFVLTLRKSSRSDAGNNNH